MLLYVPISSQVTTQEVVESFSTRKACFLRKILVCHTSHQSTDQVQPHFCCVSVVDKRDFWTHHTPTKACAGAHPAAQKVCVPWVGRSTQRNPQQAQSHCCFVPFLLWSFRSFLLCQRMRQIDRHGVSFQYCRKGRSPCFFFFFRPKWIWENGCQLLWTCVTLQYMSSLGGWGSWHVFQGRHSCQSYVIFLTALLLVLSYL